MVQGAVPGRAYVCGLEAVTPYCAVGWWRANAGTRLSIRCVDRPEEPQVLLGRALNKLVMDPLGFGIRWPWLT